MALKLLVVMNPSARDFEAEKRWPQMQPLLSAAADVTLLTTHPDNEQTVAQVTAALQQERFDRVLAIGGDGTVHLTVSALMGAGLSTLPQFAVIPFGTANNVAKSLGVPAEDVPAQARLAVSSQLRGLDVGLLRATHAGVTRTHYWVNCVSVGMDADIVAARARWRKLGKYLSYAAALAERSVEQHTMDVQLTVDGRVLPLRVFNVVVMNVPLYAGALEMPGAQMDDGKLDVFLFNRNEYTSKVLTYVLKQTDVLKVGVGDMLDFITENQRELHGAVVKVRLAFPRAFQVDGEAMGEAEDLELTTAGRLQAVGV
ncbi:MAG: diacylglycerol kinase family protein [Myxococcota bacterium]